MIKKIIYYLTPVLLAVIMFTSNFLSTDLFEIGFQNFTVWFVLSVFAFACGWIITKTLGWNHGGKVVFSVIIATSFLSVILIVIFSDYFGLSELLSENLILYTLRNITLGSMGLFGMAVAEVVQLESAVETYNSKLEDIESNIKQKEKEAAQIINEAHLKADEIVYEAQKKFDEISMRKDKIDEELKTLIRTEIELLKKYENPE